MDPMASLFGPGDGVSEAWHQFHMCTCKEVNQATVDFLHSTVVLAGSWHDNHGWVIDMSSWSALLQYVHWCTEQQVDIHYHMDQVKSGDEYYVSLATRKMSEFGG
jgi:hypothetical protein